MSKPLMSARSPTRTIGEYLREHDLMFQIKKRTLDFGVMPTELEEWIVDSPPVGDDEDHWMNIRDY